MNDHDEEVVIQKVSLKSVLETDATELRDVATHAAGPAGALPLTAEMLLKEPSGNLFGLSQNAGMGWEPSRLLDPEFLILSTHGGLRAEDGRPIALGFHTGHWEVGLLVAEAARELKALHGGAVCRGVHRSLRWAHAGYDRHDGLPAFSQRRSNGPATTDAVVAYE